MALPTTPKQRGNRPLFMSEIVRRLLVYVLTYVLQGLSEAQCPMQASYGLYTMSTGKYTNETSTNTIYEQEPAHTEPKRVEGGQKL